MKYLIPATAAAILFAVAPAQATQGMLCRPAAGGKPWLSLVIGAGGIVGASLDEGSGWMSTTVPHAPLILTQAWIDREQVLADILDSQWEPVAQLRTRFHATALGQLQTATGTLTFRGRAIPIRCEED